MDSTHEKDQLVFIYLNKKQNVLLMYANDTHDKTDRFFFLLDPCMDFIYVTILLMYFFCDFMSKGQNDEQGSDK